MLTTIEHHGMAGDTFLRNRDRPGNERNKTKLRQKYTKNDDCQAKKYQWQNWERAFDLQKKKAVYIATTTPWQ